MYIYIYSVCVCTCMFVGEEVTLPTRYFAHYPRGAYVRAALAPLNRFRVRVLFKAGCNFWGDAYFWKYALLLSGRRVISGAGIERKGEREIKKL